MYTDYINYEEKMKLKKIKVFNFATKLCTK